ncbi:MAG: histidine kinase [Desulfuromonas sp.]|nr:MAG: histidine kinase [Desulfuromonas sp.]
MTIRKRIMVILAAVYAISLVVAVTGGYFVLKQETTREAIEKTELFAAVMSANQLYMAQNIRPEILDRLPDLYFPEATVGIQMLVETAELIQQKYPEYIFRVVSPNPLNQTNLSDEFENRIIHDFSKLRYDNWEGFIEKNGKSFYATAIPIEARSGCIWCHSTPDAAHPEMVEEYGTESGYGYKIGDVVGARFIYVPTEKAMAQTMKKLGVSVLVLSVLFLIAFLLLDAFIVRSIVHPIEEITAIATDISKGHMEKEFKVRSNDEIKALADAFNRMKVSLVKAINIIKK